MAMDALVGSFVQFGSLGRGSALALVCHGFSGFHATGCLVANVCLTNEVASRTFLVDVSANLQQ